MYPEYQQQFSNDIQHDLTFNLREGYEADAVESDINGPSLVLPSIREDDEYQSDAEHVGSPRTAALLRSPLLIKSSPRRKFLQKRSVTVKSLEEDYTELDSKSLDRLTPEKSGSCHDVCGSGGGLKQIDRLDSLHQDVAALSIEVRSAIQALQEMTYSRLASNVQLCGFPPARSIPNLGNVVNLAHESEIVRSSSHPPEMWGREMGIFTMHTENPIQVEKKVLSTTNSIGTQTDQLMVDDSATGTLQGLDGLRLVEEAILANPDILLLILRKNEFLAQSAQIRRFAKEANERVEVQNPNGSKLDNSCSKQVRPTHKNNNPHRQQESPESNITSIINNSVQYYEEAEQKLVAVKNKLRRKLSSEKVRRRNNYNAQRFSAGDADLAEPEGVRANESTRSLRDN